MEKNNKQKNEKNAKNGKNGKLGFVKRRFLFVSNEALINDLAYQVKKEGHDVKYFIKDKEQKDILDGIVEKSHDWEADKEWADIIVFDDTLGFGAIAEKLRKEGRLVVAGTAYTDALEDDREFGQKVMEEVGMNVLPHWDFTDFDEAINFIKKNPGRYVLKPCGKAANEKELLYVGQEDNGKDLLMILEHYKKTWARKIKQFQLQKFAAGVEVAVGAFFNGRDFITPIFVNFEHKKLFPGEIGPSTGEMGTLGYWSPPNFIFNATLAKMREKLAEQKYIGYVDINCIANASGIHPLEFTMRFGFPTISLQIEGIHNQWGDILYDLVTGKDFTLRTKKGFQICVVVAAPPFPFYDKSTFNKYAKEAVIIFNKDINGIHPGDIKQIDGDWVLAGVTGYALIVTASGSTVELARKKVYNKISAITLPNMFYRTDIGLRWMEESDKLQTWGYLY